MLKNRCGESRQRWQPPLKAYAALTKLVVVVLIVAFDGVSSTYSQVRQKRPTVEHLETFTTRIVGGSQADESKYPWMAALFLTTDSGTRRHCGGVVVNENWIVTAAHCLLNADQTGYISSIPVGSIWALVGCADLDSSACKRVDVQRFVVHPCYMPSANRDHDDVAMLYFEAETPIADFAPMDGISTTKVNLQDGSELSLLGWGRTSNTVPSGSSVLMEVAVPLASQVACVEANPFAVEHGTLDMDSVLCTGGEAGKDSCGGDSGGPAVYEAGGQKTVVGILSKGSERPLGSADCGVAGRYGVYTRAASYAPFLDTTLAGRRFSCLVCPCSSASFQVHDIPDSSSSAATATAPFGSAAAAEPAEPDPAEGGASGREEGEGSGDAVLGISGGWVVWVGLVVGCAGLLTLCCGVLVL
eukprot:3262753-Rhodomonas_salina.1